MEKYTHKLWSAISRKKRNTLRGPSNDVLSPSDDRAPNVREWKEKRKKQVALKGPLFLAVLYLIFICAYNRATPASAKTAPPLTITALTRFFFHQPQCERPPRKCGEKRYTCINKYWIIIYYFSFLPALHMWVGATYTSWRAFFRQAFFFSFLRISDTYRPLSPKVNRYTCMEPSWGLAPLRSEYISRLLSQVGRRCSECVEQ